MTSWSCRCRGKGSLIPCPSFYPSRILYSCWKPTLPPHVLHPYSRCIGYISRSHRFRTGWCGHRSNCLWCIHEYFRFSTRLGLSASILYRCLTISQGHLVFFHLILLRTCPTMNSTHHSIPISAIAFQFSTIFCGNAPFSWSFFVRTMPFLTRMIIPVDTLVYIPTCIPLRLIFPKKLLDFLHFHSFDWKIWRFPSANRFNLLPFWV